MGQFLGVLVLQLLHLRLQCVDFLNVLNVGEGRGTLDWVHRRIDL